MVSHPAQPHRLGHVAAAIREAMTRLSLTPAELNEKLGRSRGHPGIYVWLGAKSAPQEAMRAQLAKMLGLTEADLTPREESPMPRARPGPATRAAARALAVRVPAPVPVNGTRPGPLTGHARGNDVLSFRVNAEGRARITLDVETEVAQAMPLLRMLMDAGLVLGVASDDEAPR